MLATKISFMNDLVWLILTATKEEATEGADALVICTEWKCFMAPRSPIWAMASGPSSGQWVQWRSSGSLACGSRGFSSGCWVQRLG